MKAECILTTPQTGKRKVSEIVQIPRIAPEGYTERHIAVPVHPEALILHFSDERKLMEHDCILPCPYTHIFFQKKKNQLRALGLMR